MSKIADKVDPRLPRKLQDFWIKQEYPKSITDCSVPPPQVEIDWEIEEPIPEPVCDKSLLLQAFTDTYTCDQNLLQAIMQTLILLCLQCIYVPYWDDTCIPISNPRVFLSVISMY